MGFLQQDTNNIIVDAVLTDLGRQKLAQGTFNVTKFAAGDDEVDYGMIVRYGRTVGQEKIEKNTPVFEAITNNKLALVHPLVSMPDPNRYTLPLLSLSATGGLTGDTLALGVNSTTSTAAQQQSVTVQQTLTGNETMPPELIDNQFLVACDDRFIFVVGFTPVIDRNRMATYVVSRNANATPQGGASVSIPISARAITNAQFLIYGQPSNKNNIRSVVRVTGMSSGAVKEFVVSISK